MDAELVIPFSVVESGLRQLARNPGTVLLGPVYAGLRGKSVADQLLVPQTNTQGDAEGIEMSLGDLDAWPANTQAALQLRFLQDGSWSCRQLRAIPGWPYPEAAFATLLLPGRFMHRIGTHGGPAGRVPAGEHAANTDNPLLAAILNQRQNADAGMFSRTAPALLGWDVLRRIQHTRYAVIGAGRVASLICEGLARYQVESITIIDPDVLDISNVDAMALARSSDIPDRGHASKATILKLHIHEISPGTRVRIVEQWAHHAQSIAAICDADFTISAPDHGSARFIGAAVSSIFQKPHLDIGAGILMDAQGNRELGLDVRLTIPGEKRCLCCMGGLADPTDLEALSDAARHPTSDGWRARRVGSLRSLNMVGAGLGLRLLEDMASGLRGTSAWWRVVQHGGDVPTISSGTAPVDPACPICCSAGEGNKGLGRLPLVLGEAKRRMRQNSSASSADPSVQ